MNFLKTILLLLCIGSIGTPLQAASIPGIKTSGSSGITFDAKTMKVSVSKDNVVTVTNVSNSQDANFRCECLTKKKKSCSVQTSKGKVTCGGARCCTMSTITSFSGDDMEAISTKKADGAGC